MTDQDNEKVILLLVSYLYKLRNKIFNFYSPKSSEKVGFEPTEACTSSDFKSDAIDQLCHLSS